MNPNLQTQAMAPKLGIHDDVLLCKYTSTGAMEIDFGLIVPDPSPPKLFQYCKGGNGSMATFDKCPLEIVFAILNLLDFKTILDLSCVSLGWRGIIEKFRPYQDMMSFAPEALSALARTGLLRTHPAFLLHQTLLSDSCASCSEFGGLLSLPKCDRACYECIYRNPDTWMMTTADARQCFQIHHVYMQRIPVMKAIPGQYGVRSGVSAPKTDCLVNVGQVRQLAFELHNAIGVAADPKLIAHFTQLASQTGWVTQRYFKYLIYHKVPVGPIGYDLSMLTAPKLCIQNDNPGVAYMRFPTVDGSGRSEKGLLCKGCDYTHDMSKYEKLPPHVVSSLVGPGIFMNIDELRDHLNAVTLAKRTQLLPRKQMLQHLRHCYGIQQLVQLEENDAHDSPEPHF